MRELQAAIQIAAPIDQVWKVLTDFEHWSEWNPMVNRVSGSPSVGSKLYITMRGPDSKDAMKYQPIVLDANAPNRFRWRATMLSGFLFTNDRVLNLKKKMVGRSLLIEKNSAG